MKCSRLYQSANTYVSFIYKNKIRILRKINLVKGKCKASEGKSACNLVTAKHVNDLHIDIDNQVFNEQTKQSTAKKQL